MFSNSGDVSIIDIFFQSAVCVVDSLFPGLNGAPQTAKPSLPASLFELQDRPRQVPFDGAPFDYAPYFALWATKDRQDL